MCSMHGPFINTSLPSTKRVYTNEICAGLLKTCLIWQVGIILKWNSWKRVGASLGNTLLQLAKMQGCGMKVTSNQNYLQQKHFWKHKIKKITKIN